MKIRTGFVSNSSSSSFLIPKSDEIPSVAFLARKMLGSRFSSQVDHLARRGVPADHPLAFRDTFIRPVDLDGKTYFAFYADEEDFKGKVSFRGLEKGKSYKVRDYVNEKDLGEVNGPVGTLDVEFHAALLVVLS